MLRKLTASVALCISLSASADSPSFDYIDIGFNSIEFDFFSYAKGGGEFVLRKTVADNFYIIGEYRGGDHELRMYTAGVGYKFDLSETSSLFSDISYVDINSDPGDGEANYHGYEANVGIKYELFDDFDAVVGLELLDLGSSSNVSLFINAYYEVYQNVGIYAEGRTLSENHQYSVGFRYNF
jgi:hypothetical protein